MAHAAQSPQSPRLRGVALAGLLLLCVPMLAHALLLVAPRSGGFGGYTLEFPDGQGSFFAPSINPGHTNEVTFYSLPPLDDPFAPHPINSPFLATFTPLPGFHFTSLDSYLNHSFQGNSTFVVSYTAEGHTPPTQFSESIGPDSNGALLIKEIRHVDLSGGAFLLNVTTAEINHHAYNPSIFFSINVAEGDAVGQVPLPGTLPLLVLGLGGLGLLRRRRAG